MTICSFLNQLGFTVIGHDHLGHGESVQPKRTDLWFLENKGLKMSLQIFIK